jgi:hypothetical protein
LRATCKWADEEWLGEATGLMRDLAGVGEGSRVLDIAAGAGGQTITAARRVGASGAVLATDIVERGSVGIASPWHPADVRRHDAEGGAA